MSEHSDRSKPSESRRIIDDQAREIERLRRDIERIEIEKEQLREQFQHERDRLRQKIDQLRKQLEAARRAGFRQAAPFSRGEPKGDPRRPGRKPGRAYGRKARRPLPAQVDETYEATLPSNCPECGGEVKQTHIETQYQEDLPPVRPIVRRFEVCVGRCTRCRRRVQGRHSLQTSDALGAAAAQVGPHAVALAVKLNKQLGVSFGKIATLFREEFSLQISRGGLVQVLDRAARKAEPSYEVLCATIRTSPVVTPDETGWRVGGHLQWLWAFVTPETTVYAIQAGRGFAEAAAILGGDFAGTLIRDGWAPYRQFILAVHQTCLAHLLRRCNLLQTDHPRALLPGEVKEVLQRALALRDRYAADEISPHGLAVAHGRLAERLVSILENPGKLPAIQRFANHLAVEFPAIFSFLMDPGIDATNWRAEQALRPAVITRKVCGGGNRTWRGAVTQQILASVLRTAAQRGLDSTELFDELLRAQVPTVPLALHPP